MYKNRLYLIAILSLLLLEISGMAFHCAQAQTEERFELGQELNWWMLEDTSCQLRLEEVLKRPDFRLLPHKLSAGHNKSAFWLRFQLPKGGDWLLETELVQIDHITVFVQKNHQWQATTQGDWYPFNQRPIFYHNYLFILANTTANQTIFIRVQSSGSVQFNATLWRQFAFIEHSNKESLLLGFYCALYLPIILMSLFYARHFRQPLFIAFSVTITVFALLALQHNGLLAQFIWTDNPYRMDHYAKVFLISLAFAGSIVLSCFLLNIEQHEPKLGRYLIRLSVFLIISSFSIFTSVYALFAKLAYLLYIGTLILFTALALKRLKHRRTNSRYLFSLYLAESLIICCVFLENQGIIETTFFSRSAWLLTCLLYSVLGYIILLQYAYRADNEKKQMQALALVTAQQNEQRLTEGIAKRTADLQRAHNNLEASLASEHQMRMEQRQFIAMVTHELRTPLAVIDSAAYNSELLPQQIQSRYLPQIRQSVKRIVRLIDNCLTEDRLYEQALRLQRETVELTQLINEAAEIINWSQTHRLVKQVPKEPQLVFVDPTLLRIGLSNLFDNAVKYGNPGDVILTVEWRQPYLEFKVSDSGPGIATAEFEAIFARYYQANSKRGGVGLGLYVTRAIAQLHDGDLFLSPSQQGGSCFQLRIRLK